MEKLDKIESKIDSIQEKLASIDTTLAVNTEQLKIHIHRTNLLEKQIEPIQKHVHMVDGVMKFTGGLGVIFSIVYTIVRLVKSF